MIRDREMLIGRAMGIRFMRENRTERDVSIPPAFIITDRDGGTWTIGSIYNAHMEFNVLRNDVDTGEFAERIDYSKGVVTIYGREYHKKRWTGRAFI